MDTAQLLLLIVVIVLTFLLLLLGIQVFFILKELRKSIMKVNKVLDDTGIITESVSAPIANMSSIFTSFKAGVSILGLLKKKKKLRKIFEVEEQENAESV